MANKKSKRKQELAKEMKAMRDGPKQMTLAQIGRHFNMTRQAVFYYVGAMRPRKKR